MLHNRASIFHEITGYKLQNDKLIQDAVWSVEYPVNSGGKYDPINTGAQFLEFYFERRIITHNQGFGSQEPAVQFVKWLLSDDVLNEVLVNS